MINYEIKQEQHEYKGQLMTDLVCYIKGHRFVLRPVSNSKKARAYFYALLTDTENVD